MDEAEALEPVAIFGRRVIMTAVIFVVVVTLLCLILSTLFLKPVHALVDAGNSVIVVEHDMSVVASSDWVIDMGPGAGSEGGRIVAAGTPREVSTANESRTARYLAEQLGT